MDPLATVQSSSLGTCSHFSQIFTSSCSWEQPSSTMTLRPISPPAASFVYSLITASSPGPSPTVAAAQVEEPEASWDIHHPQTTYSWANLCTADCPTDSWTLTWWRLCLLVTLEWMLTMCACSTNYVIWTLVKMVSRCYMDFTPQTTGSCTLWLPNTRHACCTRASRSCSVPSGRSGNFLTRDCNGCESSMLVCTRYIYIYSFRRCN